MSPQEFETDIDTQKREAFSLWYGSKPISETIQQDANNIQRIREDLDTVVCDATQLWITNFLKGRIQEEINYKLDQNNGSGLVIAATGVGKSKVVIDRIAETIEAFPFYTPRVLIVVPTEKLRDIGWKEEFIKWGHEELWTNNVVSVCYASLEDMTDYNFSMVVLDECHNITEANSKFFDNNSYSSVVGLTATEPRDRTKERLLKKILHKKVYEITTDVAVKLGIVAPYDITIVNVPLNRAEKNIEAGSKAKPFMQTEWSNYKYLCGLCNAKPTKFNYLKRMRFVYGLPNKTRAAQYLLKYIIPAHVRTLIFAGNIEQAEALCKDRHHSKSKKDSMLQAFKDGLIDRLSCVDSLNEGENIDNLDCALIVKLDSNSLNLVQRIGRIIRYRVGHVGKIIILNAHETVDDNWVLSATKELSRRNIKVVDMEDLATGKETIEF